MSTRQPAPWLYRTLLACFPSDFKRRFAAPMERDFQISLNDASGRDRVRVWVQALVDLAASLPREHFDVWVRSGVVFRPRDVAFDVRRAARGLARAPGLTAVVVLALTLGIAATTVIFSMVHGVLLKPLPYPDPDRIVSVSESFEESPGPLAISYVNAQDWKAAQTTFEALALVLGGALTLTTDEETRQLSALFVDAEFFDVLGASPAVGRVFNTDENRIPGGHPITVLTHDGWRRLFASDPSVIGKVLNLSGMPFSVIGVLSPSYRDPFTGTNGGTIDVIVPAMMAGQIDPRGNNVLAQRRVRTFAAIGKINETATVTAAESDLKRIAEQIQKTEPINRGMTAMVVPLSASLSTGIRGPALVLLGGAVVLLLIACFNVANLLLVRGAAREHEFAVQLALGAGRGRLVRLLTIESLLLALAAGVLGVAAAWAVLPAVLVMAPSELPPTADVGINVPVLATTLAITLAAGLGAGLVPAFTHRATKESLAQSRSVGGRARHTLVVFEIATATTLLAASALLLRSFQELTTADPGFASENLLTVGINLPSTTYADNAAMISAAQELEERIGALAGVEWSHAWGPGRPGLAFNFQTSVPDEMIVDDIGDAPLSRRHSVTPGAIEAMGIELIRGRTIAATDTENTPPVAVISESMAEELWPGQDPIGRRYHNFQPPGQPIPDDRHWTVVGVVRDARHGGRVPNAGPIVTNNDSYFAFSQRAERTFTLLAKTSGHLDATPIREAIRLFDPTIPIFQTATMAENFMVEESTSRFSAQLMAAFGFAALLLATLGVYSVLSFTVTQRAPEIGLRSALGANPSTILRLFVTRGAQLAGIGVLVGGLTAFGVTRGLQSVIPNIPDMTGWAVTTAGGILLIAAGLSCLIPAFRATRVAPMVVLRR